MERKGPRVGGVHLERSFGDFVHKELKSVLIGSSVFLMPLFILLYQVALPYPEPLIHFALVCGTRSGPALRCYSPGNIDKELMEAARDFLRNGGIVIDLNVKVASASKILKW